MKTIDLNVEMAPNIAFRDHSLWVDGDNVMKMNTVYVNLFGKESYYDHETGDGDLKKVSQYEINGHDRLGHYQAITTQWHAPHWPAIQSQTITIASPSPKQRDHHPHRYL